MATERRRWYQRTWMIVCLLALCVLSFDVLFPLGTIGLILLWRHARWQRSISGW